MRKPPADLPKEGDRVRLKGRHNFGIGVINDINPENNWVSIDWDSAGSFGHSGGNTPRICHLYELEKVD